MIIYFYILREYLKYVVGTIVLTVFLFVLFDFIHRTTKNFFEAASTATIVRFYAFQVPAQVVQALPIAALLASVVCMILLSRTNEITAMRAAGMGPVRIGLPLATGGLLLSLLSLAMGEVFVPKFAQKVASIQRVQIEGHKDEQVEGGARWYRNGQTLVNFRDYDSLTQTLVRVKMLDLGPNFRPSRSLEAAKAVYSPERQTWTLQGIRVLHFKRTGTLDRVEMLGPQEVQLPIEPKKLKKDLRKPGELSIAELRDAVKRGEQSGVDTLPYKVDLQGKFAYPFAAFVVSLIGLKFGYRSERSTETAKGVLLAFFIGISYWFILSSGRALGLRGDMPPLVAAWLPNVVILAVIVVDALRMRKT